MRLAPSVARLLACLLFLLSNSGAAQMPAVPQGIDTISAARRAAVHGPADVRLAGQASVKIPRNHVYIPENEAGPLLRAIGNRPADDFLGVIFPGTGIPLSDWFVVVRWVPSGYVTDGDAKVWDAAALLEGLKEGTEHANRGRRARGLQELEILGWVEKPAYDARRHRLVWSVSSSAKGAGKDPNPGIHYNAYALGREGYISMSLVGGMKDIGVARPLVNGLLDSLSFVEGKRYADFNPATDKAAGYGLAFLVGAAAARKSGVASFAAKFWLPLALGALALAALAAVLVKRRGAASTS